MSKALALIVDDEPDILELLEITLGRMNIDVAPALSLGEARALLQQHRFDLCLTDMRLPDGNGIELVNEVGAQRPDLPIAVITAHGNMESAIQALKAGAFDFVSKPVDLQILRKLVASALKLDKPLPTAGATRPAATDVLLGESPSMRAIGRMIKKLARSQAPVYISGESGTGKELAARLIHAQGPRREQPFIAVNCGAIPQELMESEFFGHKKGSFTGAINDKAGLFQAADGGTLFLDEVADLPVPMQVKLLRAIQEKSVRPIGAQKEAAIDIRIVSATHKDLEGLVNAGEFRQDLFYRINVIQLELPPLRERREDVPLLADAKLTELAEQSGLPKPKLEKDALALLCEYDFPGNVRELENILQRAIALSESNLITRQDLLLPEPDRRVPEPSLDKPLEDYLGEVERQALIKALDETRWNRTAAAKKLGISFRALRYRLNKLGID